jgi:hypothetical protein
LKRTIPNLEKVNRLLERERSIKHRGMATALMGAIRELRLVEIKQRWRQGPPDPLLDAEHEEAIRRGRRACRRWLSVL